jgi:DNA-binding NtrC family response regulator
MSRPPPVVVMTAHGSVGTAVEAMRAGASDFLVKPFAAERLTVTLANLLERAALRREVETLAAGAPRTGFAGFIGAAPAGRAPDPARRIRPLAEVEREAIEEAIRLCGGNIPKAAAFLGVSPSTLYRKREAWERRG